MKINRKAAKLFTLCVLLLTHASFASPGVQPVASELRNADKVFVLMAQRIELMRDVALDKWMRRTPIEDKAREAIVVKNAQVDAAREGLQNIAPLVRGQIEIAKNEQRRWQVHWTMHGLEADSRTVELSKLRQQLDTQSAVFLPALSDALPSLRDAALHPRLRKLLDTRLKQLPPTEREVLWGALLQLRFAPRRSTPPVETGMFRVPDLVELKDLDRSLKLDIRYATANNFAKRKVYAQPRAFLQRPAAQALLRAQQNLKRRGYGLVIYDGYRPWRVTKKFWEITPDARKQFVADPNRGSRHNRGCAIDVSLYDLKTGRALEMPSGYDDFSARAYPNYGGGSALARARRDLLQRVMEHEGFSVYATEWWHFDYKDWKQYRVLDIPFENISKTSR